MGRPRASVTLAACLFVSRAATAHAAPGRFELSWSAPEACPSSSTVEHRVERILNRPPSVREDEVLLVQASVKPPERDLPWRVELETDNGQRHSSRLLQAASCDELASATALLVAILIEPGAGNTEPSAAPVPPPPPPKSAAPASAPTAERASDAPTPVRFALGAFAGSVSGLLPAWSFGLGLDGAVSWKSLRWNVALAGWLPVEEPAPDNAAQGARFRLLSAAADVCLAPALSERVSTGICSGAQVDSLHAQGFGQGVRANTEQAAFVSLSAGALVSWAISNHLAFVASADVLQPLGSRHFVFEGSAPAQLHTPRAGLQLAFGMQFVLGGTETRASGPSIVR